MSRSEDLLDRQIAAVRSFQRVAIFVTLAVCGLMLGGAAISAASGNDLYVTVGATVAVAAALGVLAWSSWLWLRMGRAWDAYYADLLKEQGRDA